MGDETILEVLKEIRNWTRAASYGSVKSLLAEALPDTKSRMASRKRGQNSERNTEKKPSSGLL